MAAFHPSIKILMYKTRLVRERGTGLNGSGMESVAKMQVIAVTSAIRTSRCVRTCGCLVVAEGIGFISVVSSFLLLKFMEIKYIVYPI